MLEYRMNYIAGDTVRLSSGGPDLTVWRFNESTGVADVVWFEKRGDDFVGPLRDAFHSSSLTEVKNYWLDPERTKEWAA